MKKYILVLFVVFSVFLGANLTSAQIVNLPLGCRSTIGYSPITGVKCDSLPTNLPSGCTSTRGYSPVTGIKCDSNSTVPTNLPLGCTSVFGYSPVTGLKCDSTATFPPGCNSNQGYSNTTGQACNGTPSITTPVISGVSGPRSLNINQTGTWTVSAYNPNGGNLSYSVDWGDMNIYAAAHPNLAQQQTATFTHMYDQAGTYTPTFTVTSENTIRCFTTPCPSNGGSAQTSLSVNVGTSIQNHPDLIVSDFSWTPLNPVVNTNGQLPITITIKNIGNASATLPQNMWITEYKGNLGVGGIQIGNTAVLNPGDSKTFNSYTAASPNILETAGTFYLTVKVDGNSLSLPINYSPVGIVGESNENNNSLTKKITIISSNSATPSITVLSPNGEETYQPGQQITAKWTSNNVSKVSVLLDIYNSPTDTSYSDYKITENINNAGSYSWVIPGYILMSGEGGDYDMRLEGKKFKIMILAENDSNPKILDQSDSLFTITSSN